MPVLAVASLLLFFYLAAPAAMSPWTPIADKVEAALVFIETGAGSCSGFVIDAKKKHVLTAAHCDGEKVLADGTQTIKVFKDERKDLLVLRAYGVERPALKLAARGPDRGDEVASLGYGFALEQPMFRIAHVSSTKLEIEELSGPFVLLDAGFIPGQSGGPVVNLAGEVVAIVQRGTGALGFGVGADTIKDRVGRFFGGE
jgi:S1-C subfamily serine protease